MKGNRLVKVYDRLTPQERFVLTVAAEARGDERERAELVRTCPRHDYIMTDAEFTTRVETSELLGIAVMCDTQKMLGWLDLLAVLRPVLDDHDLSDARFASLICEKAEGVAAARVKAVWEAFQDGCREHLGVEGRILLRAYSVPLEDRLAQYADELEAVERDDDLYAEYKETITAIWRKALAPQSVTG
ncbi:MAG TPA: hypothetical protein VII06_19160 [Chloroflexota bacterium]|jgi:hypothetical protein